MREEKQNMGVGGEQPCLARAWSGGCQQARWAQRSLRAAGGVGQEGQHWAAASSSLTSFWFPVTSQISPIYLSSHRDLKLVLPALEPAEGRAA